IRHVAPRDRLILVLTLRKRDVALGARTNRVDRTHRRIAAGDVDEAVARHRTPDGDLRVGSERPQLLARCRVVAAHLRAVRDELFVAISGTHDRGRAPRRDLVGARGLPQLLTGVQIPGGDVRTLLHISLQDDRVAIDDRRARMSPLERGIEEPSAVQRTEVDAPQLLAVEVPRDEHAGRSEHRDDVLPVCRWRGAGLTALRVPLRLRRAAGRGALPENLARGFVEAVDLPFVRREIVDRFHVAVQTSAERAVAGLAQRGRDEDAVTPHDRARVRDAGDRRLPLDVLAGRDVPLGDGALTVAVAVVAFAAE